MPRPKCYMCSRFATSREHVPPKNLFPEGKDVEGANYRLNLITVPSCEEHNSQKSHDDEFLMVSLAGIIGNNSIGYMHKFTKVDRAIRNSAYRLLTQVIVEKRRVYRIETEPNKFHEVLWGTPDLERLHRCFEHVAHALHFHHFGTRFHGKVNVLLGYLFHDESNAKNWVNFIHDRAAMDLDGKPILGSNPDIFHYQVTDPDQFSIFLFKLTFYGGIQVYLAFQPESAKQAANLALELIGRGLPTIITLGAKTYAFNEPSEA
jgi:hypothetical protein